MQEFSPEQGWLTAMLQEQLWKANIGVTSMESVVYFWEQCMEW